MSSSPEEILSLLRAPFASLDEILDEMKAAQSQRDGLRFAVETLLTKGRVEFRHSGNVWMLSEADRTALELVVKLSQPPTESNPWRDVPADRLCKQCQRVLHGEWIAGGLCKHCDPEMLEDI